MPTRLAVLLASLTLLLAPGHAAARVTPVPGIPAGDPWAMVFDSTGNLYVSSSNDDVVVRVAPNGTTTTVIDATGDGTGNGLDAPGPLAVDAADNLYVGGILSNNVFRVTPGGAVDELIDASGDGVHELERVLAVAVTPGGTLYVGGLLSSNVFEVTPGGTITQILDGSGDGAGQPLQGQQGITLDGDTVYVSGIASDNVFRIAPGGAVDVVLDATGDGAGNPLDGPLGMAVGPSGDLYVGSRDHVFRRSPAGIVTAIASRAQTPALLDLFSIVLDSGGTVYAEGGNGAAQILPTGEVRTVLDESGDGEGTPATQTTDIVLEPSGTVLVSARNPSAFFRLDFPCGLAPAAGCRTSTVDLKSALALQDKTPDRGDTLTWKWLKGEATDLTDFGDPTTSTDYTLCAWDESGGTPSLSMEANARAGGTCAGNPCWKARGSKGFGYRDARATPTIPKGTPDGLETVVLKSGADGKAGITVKGKAEELELPPLPLALPHRVQMVASNGECWEATYSADGVTVNDAQRFIGKAGLP